MRDMDAESRKIARAFASLVACSRLLALTKLQCPQTLRGQIQPEDGAPTSQVARELDELKCTLVGAKPLALLHRYTGEEKALGDLCRVAVYKPPNDSGPTLLFLRQHEHLAKAAVPALEAIGAWTRGGCSREEDLSESQGHLLLGLLLGYPLCDVQAQHLSSAQMSSTPIPSFSQDYQDVLRKLERDHFVRIHLSPKGKG
mmetsp:Transcript_63655/g.132520  ORF Transcript_63655/g.132520 Transcript_63655/m.132520 type:complete len:200 (+) Transcript_63655:19-618(+)